MSVSKNMKTAVFLILSLLMLPVAQASSERIAPTARTLYPYWQMVLEVAKQIENRPPRPLGINQGLFKPGPEYSFESFRHLRSIDLLRAAREGIDFARLESARGTEESKIEQMVLENITMALEYLPLLIKDQKDIWEILNVIQNQKEDRIFRRFLLEQILGSASPSTLLSLTLPELLFSLERHRSRGVSAQDNPVAAAEIKDADEMFHETMLRLSSHPSEWPEIQALAIRSYYDFMEKDYLKSFEALDEIQEARTLQTEVDIYAVKKGEFALSRESRDVLRRHSKRLETLANAIAGHISEDSVRDENVQDVTEEVLAALEGKYVGLDEEKLALYQEGIIPEPYRMPIPPSGDADMEGMLDAFLPMEGKPLSFDAL
ncbi:MAG: hypothetical protein GX130_11275 [Candidatus Hydrogenedens sp.]|jgi:hypothetical protein|nr:hypothetical protein [Candidatus Hydrogenedens sp.]